MAQTKKHRNPKHKLIAHLSNKSISFFTKTAGSAKQILKRQNIPLAQGVFYDKSGRKHKLA